jgi:hypothetical protein
LLPPQKLTRYVCIPCAAEARDLEAIVHLGVVDLIHDLDLEVEAASSLHSLSTILNPFNSISTHLSEKGRFDHQKCEGQTARSQAVRVPGVRGQGQGRGSPAQVSWVQSGVVLQQGARRAAHARARELLRRADSDLRPSGVRGESIRACDLSPVQGGVVLQQKPQVSTHVGAREQVRGAARDAVERFFDSYMVR